MILSGQFITVSFLALCNKNNNSEALLWPWGFTCDTVTPSYLMGQAQGGVGSYATVLLVLNFSKELYPLKYPPSALSLEVIIATSHLH